MKTIPIIQDYQDFIQSKKHSAIDNGIEPTYMPDCLFDYQKHITELSIRKGRFACFVDTGLGKTLIQLVIARNYNENTNKPVLIITPLAVAFQFIKEANDFDICEVEYSKDGKFTAGVVVCNYERLDKFNPTDFDCVILDESSILKNYDGAYRNMLTQFLKRVKYRFLSTATPSPNDFIELGTSSEALGFMGYTDMLTKYFTNNEDTISPQKIGTKWILKGHAEEAFFDWVRGWSISMRKPSDLGFSDAKHVLPELITNFHSVENKENMTVNGQIQLFNAAARTLPEVRDEQRLTIIPRCEKAVELASPYEKSVYWCNLNKESETIAEMDSSAIQIHGSMNIDKKEEMLLGFFNGDFNKLITKPKMTAFGLNWQHCNHTVFFPTFSYEQYYQSIRRFWRFGQKRPVTVDIVHSDGQQRVIDSLFAKTEKANSLFNQLNASLNQVQVESKTNNITKIKLPEFVK